MAPEIATVGWDLGGAHLKVALLDGQGQLVAVETHATPLWRGLDGLQAVLAQVSARYRLARSRHALTMTGELADIFADRAEGVGRLLTVFSTHFAPASIRVYAGSLGLIESVDTPAAIHAVASANWQATASLAARRAGSGLLVDVGSTTTDLVLLRDGAVHARGHSDRARLVEGELVYTGVVRTPVMRLTEAVPFQGRWVDLVAEHFATTADVYRVLGCLPVRADLGETADGRAKTVPASRARLARMLGADAGEAPASSWQAVAAFLAQCQFERMLRAAYLQCSRGLAADAPVIGAGVGRFLVRRLAGHLGRPYRDLIPTPECRCSVQATDAAPAVAVAMLLAEDRAGVEAPIPTAEPCP